MPSQGAGTFVEATFDMEPSNASVMERAEIIAPAIASEMERADTIAPATIGPAKFELEIYPS